MVFLLQVQKYEIPMSIQSMLPSPTPLLSPVPEGSPVTPPLTPLSPTNTPLSPKSCVQSLARRSLLQIGSAPNPGLADQQLTRLISPLQMAGQSIALYSMSNPATISLSLSSVT